MHNFMQFLKLELEKSSREPFLDDLSHHSSSDNEME